jgi:hypothetical protein
VAVELEVETHVDQIHQELEELAVVELEVEVIQDQLPEQPE